jgi:hypothetical protein
MNQRFIWVNYKTKQIFIDFNGCIYTEGYYIIPALSYKKVKVAGNKLPAWF